MQCPRCGLLYSGFRETGRLGCADCYTAFQFQLRPLLRRIHGDTRHRGKRPAGEGEGATRFRQIQRLHDELQRVVEREEFERAAVLRDEIRQLEQETRSGRGGEAMSGPDRPPAGFDELVARPARWLSAEGPHADLVLSSRIRLARNLRSVPFTHRAREEQLQGVLMSVSGAAQRGPSFAGSLLLRMAELVAARAPGAGRAAPGQPRAGRRRPVPAASWSRPRSGSRS